MPAAAKRGRKRGTSAAAARAARSSCADVRAAPMVDGAAAADAHLRWLESVVAGAQGKVMILGHIPPASGELLPFLPPTDYCTSLGR